MLFYHDQLVHETITREPKMFEHVHNITNHLRLVY